MGKRIERLSYELKPVGLIIAGIYGLSIENLATIIAGYVVLGGVGIILGLRVHHRLSLRYGRGDSKSTKGLTLSEF